MGVRRRKEGKRGRRGGERGRRGGERERSGREKREGEAGGRVMVHTCMIARAGGGGVRDLYDGDWYGQLPACIFLLIGYGEFQKHSQACIIYHYVSIPVIQQS